MHEMVARQLRILSLCFCCVVFGGQGGQLVGAQGAEQTIRADDARPLATVVRELEKRLGWVVTYEDPPWNHPSEMVDVTASVRRDGNMSAKVFSPIGGRFEFSAPTSRSANRDAVLRSLVERYNRSGNNGVFRVVQTGEVYHVVPTMARNQLAALEDYRSLLSRNISVPEGDRRVAEMLLAILAALNNLVGARKLELATVPTNLVMRSRVRMSVTNEDARSVLLRTLDATGRKLSWRILCEAGLGKPCYMNLHVVE